jgi:hypothetical protein
MFIKTTIVTTIVPLRLINLSSSGDEFDQELLI